MNTGKVDLVKQSVKTRRYDNARRAEQAELTRRAILEAARDLFASQGYARTTVGAIAERAGVAVDTLYSSVGRKPDLMRALIETSISGEDRAVPAEERDYVQRILAAGDTREQLAIYAAAIVPIQARMAPIFLALRDAALTDEDCEALWSEISERRSDNMLRMAGALRATGGLRTDLTDRQVADILWSTNAAEYWDLLVTRRGWSPEEFGAWLLDAWSRLLLAPTEGP